MINKLFLFLFSKVNHYVVTKHDISFILSHKTILSDHKWNSHKKCNFDVKKSYKNDLTRTVSCLSLNQAPISLFVIPSVNTFQSISSPTQSGLDNTFFIFGQVLGDPLNFHSGSPPPQHKNGSRSFLKIHFVFDIKTAFSTILSFFAFLYFKTLWHR